MKIAEAIWYLTPIRNSASLERYRDALTTALDALEFQRQHEHPLTNADRIRAMTDEELCELFMGDPICDQNHSPDCGPCKKCIMAWLRQPVKEDT